MLFACMYLMVGWGIVSEGFFGVTKKTSDLVALTYQSLLLFASHECYTVVGAQQTRNLYGN